MRRRKSNKSQTNFFSETKFLLLSFLLLGLLAGGCAGGNFSSKAVWEKTKSTVQSVYVKTQRAVTNTLITIGKYQRDHAYGRKKTGETQTTKDKSNRNPVPRPTETPRMDDRFPSRTPDVVEENLRPDQTR